MRFISSICIKLCAAVLSLCLLFGTTAALAMDDNLSLAMISVKTNKLNPLVPEEREFQSLTALIYEGLYSIDDNYMPQLNIASKCDIEGKKWFITLRDDVTFHDGTPLTAYDVEATINEILRLANAGQGQYAQLKYIVTSVSVNDASSLVLTVNRPYYGTYYALTFPILPASQVTAENPVGTGPYKVDTFVPASHLHLSANENWRKGTPYVKYINVSLLAENRLLLDEYEFNRVDAAITRSASSGQYRTGVTNLNIPYRTQQLETLLVNNRMKPLDDIRIRKAIRYAIDVDAICNNVYNGTAIRTDTPMPYGTWMYAADDTVYEYNPEKAKALLAEAGWSHLDGDTILDKYENDKNTQLTLNLYVYEEQENNVRSPAAYMIQDMLAAVGIDVNITTYTFARATEKLNAASFHLALAAFQMDPVPDPGFLLMSNNTGNYGLYKSKDMDNLFQKLRTTMDFSEYQSLLHQIQTKFGEDCPFICLYYRSGALLTRKVFTNAYDIREPEILRGIESISN